MGIDGLDDIIKDNKIEETPVPETDQICKCDHSLAKHYTIRIGGREKKVCNVEMCPCSDFKLNHIK